MSDAAGLVRELGEARTRIASLEAELARMRTLSALGRRARSVAHDVGNLLAAVAGFNDLMLRSISRDSRLRARAESIRIAVESAQRLVRQLLAADVAAVRPSADLNAVVTAVTRTVSPLLGQRIALQLRLDPAVGVVATPAGAVEQVTMNLVLNARDAMPSGGRVIVATGLVAGNGHRAPAAMLTVEDTGVGMEAATLRRAFEPHFTTKPTGQGTGLGLWTVRELVGRYGGRIDVTSTPGEGSVFRVCWPLADRAPADSASVTPAPVVLVVENEPGVADVLVEILELYDYRARRARDAEEALAACARDPGGIAVVVADLDAPGVADPQFAEWLRAVAPRATLLHLAGGVAKPLAIEALVVKVREALAGAPPTD